MNVLQPNRHLPWKFARTALVLLLPLWAACDEADDEPVGTRVDVPRRADLENNAQDTSQWGKFEGKLRMEVVSQGRRQLLNPYTYVSPELDRWTAAGGYVTDGASIPRGLWPIVGRPFDGEYLHAAVIHDFFCDENPRTRTWEDTHLMFHHACRCAGVSAFQAKLLYGGVYFFGPRWSTPGAGPPGAFASARAEATIRTSSEWKQLVSKNPQLSGTPLAYDFEHSALLPTESAARAALTEEGRESILEIQRALMSRLSEWIESENPTLEEIRAWQPADLSSSEDTKGLSSRRHLQATPRLSLGRCPLRDTPIAATTNILAKP